MKMTTHKTKAACWGAKAAFITTKNKINRKPLMDSSQSRTAQDGLPTPYSYYKKLFPYIVSGREWVNVRCCFHIDKNPSLSINLKSGGYFCHACGAKGGDVLSFHMRKNQMTFKATVAALTVKNGAK
jgi:hypothetical protein